MTERDEARKESEENGEREGDKEMGWRDKDGKDGKKKARER